MWQQSRLNKTREVTEFSSISVFVPELIPASIPNFIPLDFLGKVSKKSSIVQEWGAGFNTAVYGTSGFGNISLFSEHL